LNATSSAIDRIISLQYNPGSLSRSLKGQAIENANHSEALRLKGPPVETYALEAEIDATDQLEFPEQNPEVQENGLARCCQHWSQWSIQKAVTCYLTMLFLLPAILRSFQAKDH